MSERSTVRASSETHKNVLVRYNVWTVALYLCAIVHSAVNGYTWNRDENCMYDGLFYKAFALLRRRVSASLRQRGGYVITSLIPSADADENSLRDKWL